MGTLITYNVNTDGDGDYTSLAAALDQAFTDYPDHTGYDLYFACSGVTADTTRKELPLFTGTGTITIEGDNRSLTYNPNAYRMVITGNYAGNGLTLRTPNITIKNLQIHFSDQGSTITGAIFLSALAAVNCLIENNIIIKGANTNGGFGIYSNNAYYTGNNIIRKNLIVGFRNGIEIRNRNVGAGNTTFSHNNTIANCTVSGIVNNGEGTLSSINDIVYNCVDSFLQTLGTLSITHSTSDDGDGDSANVPADWDTVFTDKDNGDFTLLTTDTDAYGQGADMSLSFTENFEQLTITQWDRGYDITGAEVGDLKVTYKGKNIIDSEEFDLGIITSGKSVDVVLSFYNGSAGELTFVNTPKVTITGTGVILKTDIVESNVDALSSVEFTITISGAVSGNIAIETDHATESTFNFDLSATSQSYQKELYIRQDASGSATGMDYENAFNYVPKVLERSALYYVAKGKYGQFYNDHVDGEPFVQPFDYNLLNPNNIFWVDNTNPSASDTNAGSEELPFLTLMGAEAIVPVGSKIKVRGVYDETLTITNSGADGSWRVYEAVDYAECRSIAINANYIAVNGFNVIDDADDRKLSGTALLIGGNNIFVLNNRVIDFLWCSAIGATSNRTNVQVENNYVYMCASCLSIRGTNWLVRYNELERVVQPIESYDADYCRFFGDNIVIQHNYLHGSSSEEVGTSHTDAFQTYYPDNGSAKNVLIEHNIAEDFYHQFVMARGIEVDGVRTHENFYIRNNVIKDADAWAVCAMGILNVNIYNNTIINMQQAGIGIRNEPGDPTDFNSTATIYNNIFVNGLYYYGESGCTIDAGYNIVYPLPTGFNYYVDPGTDIHTETIFTDDTNIIGADGIPFTVLDGLIPVEGANCYGTGEYGTDIGAYSPDKQRQTTLFANEDDFIFTELTVATADDHGNAIDWDADYEGTTDLGDIETYSNYIDAFQEYLTYTLDIISENGIVLKVPENKIYLPDAQVIIEAIPDVGYQFDGWSGDLVSLNNPETVTMDSDKVITALYTIIPPSLTVKRLEDTIEHESTYDAGDLVHKVGDYVMNDSFILTFQLPNNYLENIELIGENPITVSGEGFSLYSVSETLILPGESSYFQVLLIIDGTGEYSCDISIVSSGVIGTFTFTLDCNVIEIPAFSTGGTGVWNGIWE